jgi:hypothetical protein
LEASDAEILSRQLRVLTGQDERRRQAARGERMSQGRKFDGFGPGADDQPNFPGTQPSP